MSPAPETNDRIALIETLERAFNECKHVHVIKRMEGHLIDGDWCNVCGARYVHTGAQGFWAKPHWRDILLSTLLVL